MECKCYIEKSEERYLARHKIIQCPLCRSAPDLYEFARQVERSELLEELPNWLEGLRNILTKAEGK